METRKNKNKKKSYRYFAKYSGMTFEMLGIIFLGTFAGYKIDAHNNSEFPLWTLILSLLSVFAALYIVLKDFIKKK